MLPDLLYILFASCVASGNGGPTLSDNPFYRVNSCVEDAFRNGDFRRRYPDIMRPESMPVGALLDALSGLVSRPRLSSHLLMQGDIQGVDSTPSRQRRSSRT